MKVYVLHANEPYYRRMTFISYKAFFKWYRRFNGNPVKRYWTGKEKFRYVPGDMPKGDIPFRVGGIVVFSFAAVSALSDLLEPSGELLRIRCQKDTLFFYNVTRVVDALDERSSVLQEWDRGRIMAICRYSFLEDRLVDVPLFKLPQCRLAEPYVTEPFVQRVREAGLKGFEFEIVYSTGEEPGPGWARPCAISR